jgi:hypothetical protein
VIARVHGASEDTVFEAERRLRAAYTIGEAAPANPLLAARIDPPKDP